MRLFSCCCGQNRPPHKQDGPWSILVLVCTFLQSWLLIGTVRGFGVYLPVLMNEFDVGRDKIAFVFSLSGGLGYLFTLLVTWLNSFIDNRIVCGVGHLFLIIAFTVSSTVRRVDLLYLTFSIFFAFGKSLIIATHILVIVKYFKKHRSLAQGINSSGGALGVMTVPNILQYLLDSVGWRNAFRIQAASVFVLSFLCLVFSQNVEKEMHDVQDTVVSSSNMNTNNIHAFDGNDAHAFVSKNLEESSDCHTRVDNHHNQAQGDIVQQSEQRQNQSKEKATNDQRQVERTLGKNVVEEERKEDPDGTNQQMKREEPGSNENKMEYEDRSSEGGANENVPANRKAVSLRSMLDLSVWKVPTYRQAVISVCVASFAMLSNTVHLVKFSEEKAGLSGTRAATLFTFLGLASLIARIVAGKLCDISCINPSMVNMAAELLAGINTFLLTLSTNYIHLAILNFVHGFADGMFRTTFIVLFTTSVERSKSGSALGQAFSLIAPFEIAGPAITGLLAEVFDGYTNAYYVNGCVFIAAAAIHLIPPLLRLCKPSSEFTLEQIEMSSVHDDTKAGHGQDDPQASKTNPSFIDD